MEEEWRDIPGYEGLYQVSSLGRIKGFRGGIRKPTYAKNGYEIFQTRRGGIVRNDYVHRLVLLAFVGPCPEGLEVCHNDSNPKNNRLDNLRYDTRKANRADALLVGHISRQKLSVETVRLLRSQYGHLDHIPSVAAVAARYGVNRHAITNAVRGRTFKCIT